MIGRIVILTMLIVFVIVSVSFAVDQKVVMDIQGMTCEL